MTKTRFSIVEPMSRPGVQWYSEAEEVFRKVYTEKIVGLGRINVNVVKMDDLPSQLFDKKERNLKQLILFRFSYFSIMEIFHIVF